MHIRSLLALAFICSFFSIHATGNTLAALLAAKKAAKKKGQELSPAQQRRLKGLLQKDRKKKAQDKREGRGTCEFR